MVFLPFRGLSRDVGSLDNAARSRDNANLASAAAAAVRKLVAGRYPVADLKELADLEREAVFGAPIKRAAQALGQRDPDADRDGEAGDAALADRFEDRDEGHRLARVMRLGADIFDVLGRDLDAGDDAALGVERPELQCRDAAEHDRDVHPGDALGVAGQLDPASAAIRRIGDQHRIFGAAECIAELRLLAAEIKPGCDLEGDVEELQRTDLDDAGIVDIADLDPRRAEDRLHIKTAACRRQPLLERLDEFEIVANDDVIDGKVEPRRPAILGDEPRLGEGDRRHMPFLANENDLERLQDAGNEGRGLPGYEIGAERAFQFQIRRRIDRP